MAFSFLFFYLACVGLFLGALLIRCFANMVHPLWLAPFAPSVARLQNLDYLAAPLFLLLWLLRASLYPWASGVEINQGFRAAYLSSSGFLGRGIFYWILWLLLNQGAKRNASWAGGFGIALLLFSGSLASFDWLLSLQPHFGSTAFGLMYLLNAILLTFGFLILARKADSTSKARQDQASVLLAVVCVSLYVSFMQFLVIWSGNIPSEVAYYRLRFQNGWYLFPTFIVILQFVIPFFLLLQIPFKRSPKGMQILAACTVLLQLAYLYWQISPAHQTSPGFSASDLAAYLAVLAIGVVLVRKTA